MKRMSINNGITYLDLDNLTWREKNFISYFWREIEYVLDREAAEKANDITNADCSSTQSKIEYLKDYLSVATHDLVIG